MIFIHFRGNNKLLKNHNYIFLSYQQTFNRFEIEENVLSHIIDVHMCAVQVNNILDTSIIIDKNFRLNIVHDYEEKKCYAMFTKNNHLTARNKLFQKMFKTNVEMLIILDAAKDFNEFIKTFIIIIKKFSSSANYYHLFSLTLTHSEFFRKHFKVFDKHFKIKIFEYITLKEIIIYDTTEIQR